MSDELRKAFETLSHFDYSMKKDAWGRDVYQSDFIQCKWEGYLAGIKAQEDAQASHAEPAMFGNAEEIQNEFCNHMPTASWYKTGFCDKPLYTRPQRRLTAKQVRELVTPIIDEYQMAATPFIDLLEAAQDKLDIRGK